MNILYLLPALAASLAFYLACAHQRFVPSAVAKKRPLRAFAWLCTLLSIALAYVQLGVWAGVFAALTALMTGLVALPYLDAWWYARQEKPHVG
jgi:TctA family transporter